MKRALLAPQPALVFIALVGCLLSVLLGSPAFAKRKVRPTPPPPTSVVETTQPAPSPTPVVEETTIGGCAATLTLNAGTPWRAATCATPSYTNSLVPSAPVLHQAETTKIRTLPGALLNIDAYTEPVYYSTSTTPIRSVRCVSWGCVGGTTAPIRGDEIVAPGSDGQLVIVDVERRRTFEMWQVVRDADGTVRVNADGTVTVGSMSVVDLDGAGNKTADGRNLNITGAGVSRLFGVIRAHEVRAAATSPATAIPHALQVTLPSAMNCSGTFREPATKTDGRSSSTDCVQEGARVQLDPTYDCAVPPTKMGRAICYAMQKYGAYVMDNNGSSIMAFFAQHRLSWPNAATDYAAVGITRDYQNMGIPMTRLRVLARWNGQ